MQDNGPYKQHTPPLILAQLGQQYGAQVATTYHSMWCLGRILIGVDARLLAPHHQGHDLGAALPVILQPIGQLTDF